MSRRPHVPALFASVLLVLVFSNVSAAPPARARAAAAHPLSSASGAVATSLLREGMELPGAPGHHVMLLNNTAVNHNDGFAVSLDTFDGFTTLSRVWGNPTGGPGVVLRTEGNHAGLNQTAFESFFGFADAGPVAYSATGTGGPVGNFDSVWLDNLPVAVQGNPSSVPGWYWTFASRPGVTGSGQPYWVGGLATSPSGSVQNRGLFYGLGGSPLLLGGQSYPNLPFPLSMTATNPGFDYRLSALGTHVIAPVTMQTVATSDGAMMLDGAGLMIHGSLVREQNVVPPAAGGDGIEQWTVFNLMGVNEASDWFFTASTNAIAAMNSVIVRNGMITHREGQVIDGEVVTGAVQAASLNEDGDLAYVWPVAGGTLEALFVNDSIVLREGDAVDLTGDGLLDPGAILRDFTGISAVTLADRSGGLLDVFFTADIDTLGTPTAADDVEGYFCVTVVAPSDGDLSRAEAIALVESNIISPSPYADRLVGFLYNQTAPDSVLLPGTVVTDRDSSFFYGVSDPTYLFWLDLATEFEIDNHNHYILLNQVTGTLTVFPSQNWPRVNGLEVPALTLGNMSPDLFHGAYLLNLVNFEFEALNIGNAATWAIICVGKNLTGQDEKNARKNDTMRIKKAINEAPMGPQVPKDNIKESSGTNYCGSTKQEVCDLLATVTGCQKLFFFYIGHGADGKMITAGGDFTYKELAMKLLGTGATEVCIVLEACNSGSAVKDLRDTTVPGADGKPRGLKGSVVTSSPKGVPTHREADGAPFIKAFLECMLDPSADLNNDGKTSTIEAVAWARAQNATVAADMPQGSTLGDGKKIEFPAPTKVEFTDSHDGGGTLHYSVEGTYYKIIKGAASGKDSLVCRQTVYVRNESGSDHVGQREVEVFCKMKNGMTTVIKKTKPKLKAKKNGKVDKICLGDVPPGCTKVCVRKVMPAPGILEPQSVEIFGGTDIAHRTTVYSAGEPIFQDIEVVDPPGIVYQTQVDALPGWMLTIDPTSFTTNATLDTETVIVRGRMPDLATEGGAFCAGLFSSVPDTSSLRVEALLYGSLGAPITGGQTYTYRALTSASGISVSSGTAHLFDTRLDLSAATSVTVGPAGTLEIVRSAVRPDSGVSYSAQVSGSLLWDQGSVVGATGGLVLNAVDGTMAGGSVLDAVGDGLTLIGDQANLDASFLLLDGSTDDGLVLDATTNCRLDWIHIVNSGGNDVELLNNATVELVDSDFDNGKIAVPAGSTLTRSWSTGFHVTTPAGTSMPNVAIEIRNALGALVALDTTEVSGMSDLHALVEYRRAGAVLTAHTPHTVTLSYAGLDTMFSFAADSTQVVHVPWDAIVSGQPGDPNLPVVALLSQNTPNPFLKTTRIRFALPATGPVRLSVYDLQGREVDRLIDEVRTAGDHEFLWEPKTVCAGVYWYRLEAAGAVRVRKLVMSAR